ncbi:MAG: hypothetical protein NTW21_19420 [Verrucomicrobia bacterium]|nr:hypothetical protein [Verrucomicrobiota bacterium]
MSGKVQFALHSAGPGQSGKGTLVVTDFGVRVNPVPEAAWKAEAGGNRKPGHKLVDSAGRWNTWFLLARALVLSRDALDESERALAPVATKEQADSDLKAHARAMFSASEARRHALTQFMTEKYDAAKAAAKAAAKVANAANAAKAADAADAADAAAARAKAARAKADGFDIEGGATERAFVNWFGSELADRLSRGEEEDIQFAESVIGFVRLAHSMRQDFPAEVRSFYNCLAQQAKKAGGVPTKESVRLGLGGGMDTFDTDKFKALVKRTGFGWLPQGKSGPKPKYKTR